MARKSGRAALVLTQAQAATLKELSRSRTAPSREVERAKVLLGYAGGTSITELQRQLGVGRPMIYKCVDKALVAQSLLERDPKQHRGKHAGTTRGRRGDDDAHRGVDLLHPIGVNRPERIDPEPRRHAAAEQLEVVSADTGTTNDDQPDSSQALARGRKWEGSHMDSA